MRYATREKLAPYASALKKYMTGNTETVRALYLDGAGRIILSEDITRDGATATAAQIDSRRFIRTALDCDARAVVVAHNHPGGPLVPSADDDAMVRALGKVCAWIGVKVTGNLLFARGQWLDLRHKKK